MKTLYPSHYKQILCDISNWKDTQPGYTSTLKQTGNLRRQLTLRSHPYRLKPSCLVFLSLSKLRTTIRNANNRIYSQTADHIKIKHLWSGSLYSFINNSSHWATSLLALLLMCMRQSARSNISHVYDQLTRLLITLFTKSLALLLLRSLVAIVTLILGIRRFMVR